MKPVLIVGNGIAGITAARTLRKLSSIPIIIISSESKYFFSRTALMYIYMGQMTLEDTMPYEDWFWEKNKIELVQGRVNAIRPDLSTIELEDGTSYDYSSLILACGSSPNILNIPGHKSKGVSGMYSLQDLQIIEKYTQNINEACIIGGGLIGIELAEMLSSRDINVHLIIREASYWSSVLPAEESEMVSEHIEHHDIHLHRSQEAESIEANHNGRARKVVLKNGDKISSDFVGITIGVHPNIQWINCEALESNRGILVDPYLRTNISNIYAIGDCAELRSPSQGRRAIEAVWYTGRMMGETVAHTIAGSPKVYNPGMWFNSAKFLDIEYQVYGKIQSKPDPGELSFFWKHSNRDISFRIQYQVDSSIVVGFNLMGLRFRHEQCHAWIQSRATVAEVLKNLHLAFFDPEFYDSYHRDILEAYAESTGVYISVDSQGIFQKLKRWFV